MASGSGRGYGGSGLGSFEFSGGTGRFGSFFFFYQRGFCFALGQVLAVIGVVAGEVEHGPTRLQHEQVLGQLVEEVPVVRSR